MVFFEGVTVQRPLTVINSKFSQPFLNFPNRFPMNKRHKTGFKKPFNTKMSECYIEPMHCLETIYIPLKCN